MKKTLRRSILFTLFLACVLIPLMGQRVLAADVAIDADSFPDDVFRSYVETFDTDHDGALSDAERNAVTAISCDGLGVKSISGVEQFEKLETLSLKDCTSLKYFPGKLSALDALVTVTVDGCTALREINLDHMGDALTNLSARSCTALESCTFDWCKNVASLDLSGCTALKQIDSIVTQFSTIKVDGCTSLTHIQAGGSGKLDLSTCPEIRYIYLDKGVSELDLTNCSKLEELNAGFSVLRGGLDLSDCVSLKKLNVAYCDELYSLDVTHCPQLEILSCGNNHDITSLDVTHNPKLRELSCQTTGITALDISKCPELTVLECGDQMTALDVSHNTKLKVLNCAANKLTSLDVSMLPDLAELNCNGNELTTLDVTHNPKLKTLYCRGNKLTTLDVTANPELKDLFCCDNNLATLDLRKTPFLNQHVLKGEEIIETGYPDYGKHIQYLYKGSKFENGVKVDKDTHILTASCTVIWANWDGTPLLTDNDFPVGTIPYYSGTKPTREADAQYTYIFDGWTPEPAPAESGINTYTAVFKTETNSYQITFVNWDGTELQSGWVDYGATPVYSGAEPEKPGTAQYNYTFKEWTPAIVPVTEDATYTAVFDESVRQYTVTWVIDGTSETETYAYGETPAHADPTKPATAQYNYTFKEWTPAIVPVTEDATYTAVFDESVRQYTVTWVIDGTSETETYTYGETPAHADPTKPATAQYNYTFKEWTPAIVPVTEDATYTAVFDESVRQYTVTWVIDGKKETEIYAYGETPAHKNPAKSAGPHFSYVFKEWTPAIVPVTGNATYTAVFYKDPVPKPVIPETPVFPFIDVTPDSPFYDDIVYVWENRLMNGMSDTIFGTNLPLTRGMIVTVLWRMEGSPAVDFSGVFTDVSAGAWYADGVEWAAAHGIVLGYGNRTYGPQDSVTREQLAAILFRYAKFKGYDVSIGENTNILSYDDALRISSWAFPAMQWACGTNVLNSGKTAAIRPAAPATRGEIAHAIHFFLEKTAK